MAVNCCVLDGATVESCGATVNVKTETDALAVSDLSALLAAVIVWLPSDAGAVYDPLALIVPTLLLPPAIPSTDQVTAVLDKSVTVALNCCVCPVSSVDVPGETATPFTTVTEAFAMLEVCAVLAALTVCDPG